MKSKNIIAIICLIVLCIQVIPLRQIGAMLFNNQITEELAHSSDCGKKITQEKEFHHSFHTVFSSLDEELSGTNGNGIHAHSPLIKQHIKEVPTPPPNVV
jgi:hypothetical protein